MTTIAPLTAPKNGSNLPKKASPPPPPRKFTQSNEVQLSTGEANFWYRRFMAMVNRAEEKMLKECELIIGINAKKHAEHIAAMFSDDGYTARIRTDTWPETGEPIYSLVVTCKYKSKYSDLRGELYALLDTRNGHLVTTDNNGRTEYAVFGNLQDALGPYGMRSDEVTKNRGEENIRIVTMTLGRIVK